MIPQIHRDFIAKAVESLTEDSRIVGVALGGSYIAGSMDEYSDLDFVVAVDPCHIGAVMAERTEIAGQIGTLLSCFTGEHIGVPSLLICLYDHPLLHVDFNFVTPEEKRNRIEDPVILYEKDGALSRVIGTTKPQRPPLKLQWYEDRFWVWVHYIAAKIGRGELFDAIDAITFIRGTVLGPMIQAEKGILQRGVRFLERDAPEYLPKLADTVPAYNCGSCNNALKASIALYRTLRAPHETKLLLRTEAEKRAVEYFMEVYKTTHPPS